MTWTPSASNDTDSYDRLYTTLTSKLPGASKAQLEQEIANTFQAFCRETHVWRELVERNLIGGLSWYELSPASNNAKVHFIISVEVNERPYIPMGDKAIPRGVSWGAYQVQPDYKSIELFPTPSGDSPKGLKAWIGLVPLTNSLDIPCEIIDHYFESIQDGVLERMYGHVNRPYTDPNKEERHRRKFHAAVTRVRREVRAGNAQASPPWRFPTQAPGRPLRGAKAYGW